MKKLEMCSQCFIITESTDDDVCPHCGGVFVPPLKASASLTIKFDIVCPECDQDIDLTHSDHEGEYLGLLFSTPKTVAIQEALKDTKIECPCCEMEFVIEGTEY